uniref:Uncharacterized protein n=1 Tax=Anopheles coluzzii TaxID=1518534 RepID=A0A8W7PE78_ANOCL
MVFRLVVTPPSRLFSVFVIVDSVLVSSVPAAVPMLVTAVFSAFSVEETTLFTRFSIGRFVLIVPLPATPMLPRLRLPLRVPEVPEINEHFCSPSRMLFSRFVMAPPYLKLQLLANAPPPDMVAARPNRDLSNTGTSAFTLV